MSEPANRVTVVDVDVPFTRLVAFFIKAGLALVPALIVLWLAFALLGFLLHAVLPGLWWGGHWRWW